MINTRLQTIHNLLFSGIFGLLITACSGSNNPDTNGSDPAANEIPRAMDDVFVLDHAATAVFDIAANDSDSDDGLDLSSVSLQTQPLNGMVQVNGNGTVDYTHNGSNTLSDQFTYTIKDLTAAVSNSATVNITINPLVTNNAPVAGSDDFTVNQDSNTLLNLSSNDSDSDDGLDLASIALVSMPTNGTIQINNNGSVNYLHDGSATVSDHFSYTINDLSGTVSNTADVDITISPGLINSLPVAIDDNFSVGNGSTTHFDLAANDVDADDGLNLASINIQSLPSNGSILINANGTVDYTHNGSPTITDQFTYTIEDASAAVSNIATVRISILPSVVTVGIYDSTVVEGTDNLEFVVSLSAAHSEAVSVNYTTLNGTALESTDYTTNSGTLVFLPGETRKFITVGVLINNSAPTNSSKDLQLELSNPVRARLDQYIATGHIIDRDYLTADSSFDHNWDQIGAFTNAAKCGESCHRASDPTMVFNNQDISPNTQWQHSVMAHSFNDPYWQAAVEDETTSFPELSGFIEDTCLTCHAPMAITHAHATGSNLDTDGFYRFDSAIAADHAREGVSCTACHQIDDSNLGTPGSFSGGYNILTDPNDPNYKRIYGPYDNPVGSNMNMQTGHRPTAGAHTKTSEMCATCHTLYTPTIDAENDIPTGDNFLEQAPFLEWKNSVYATGESQEAQCQACHMPEPQAGYSTKISLFPGNAPSRTPYGQHGFLGGNSHLLEILRDYSSELGIADTTTNSGFNEQINQTRSFLTTAASLSISPVILSGNEIRFDVEITNHTGHKLPSSYPSRRMWLQVTVKDHANAVVFESGNPDSRGYIETDDARLKADCVSAHKLEGFDSLICYEPHRNIINDPSQIAIYETVLGNTQGHITHTLLYANRYLKDNRIPPAGFTNNRANIIEPQTLPSGVSADNDFNCIASAEGCGSDTVHYRINNNGQVGPYSVEVQLLYQATQPAFVDGLHNQGDRIHRFKVMYDAVPPSVEVLASATN